MGPFADSEDCSKEPNQFYEDIEMSDTIKITTFAQMLDVMDGSDPNPEGAAKTRGWLSADGGITDAGRQLLKAFDDQSGTQASFRCF